MEDTINIAGVNCKVGKLATLDYETLFNLAINNIKWKGVKNKESYIDKELKEHGFRKNIKQGKENKPRVRKKTTSRRNKR